MPALFTSHEIDFGCMSEKGCSWTVSEVNEDNHTADLSLTDCNSNSPLSRINTAPGQGLKGADLTQMLSTKTAVISATMAHKAYRMPPAANIVPPEILSQIYFMLSPRDFDNARRTCSQWMRISLQKDLLEVMLKKAGWWDAWQRDCQTHQRLSVAAEEQSLVWRMSKRFATECILSGRKTNVEKVGFLTTTVVDFSKLSHGLPALKARGPLPHTVSTDLETTGTSKFNVSNCGNYLLVTSGCMIYVYRLLSRKAGDSMPVSLASLGDVDLVPISSITCSADVLSATIDTSTPRIVVAVLLRGRIGMICDLDITSVASQIETNNTTGPSAISQKMLPLTLTSQHFYHDVCSPDDPPRSVSICPGRRCVAFGCGNGIELHWVDENTKRECRKYFPMSQPSEILHFLPSRPETPMELRLISSLAGPGLPGCQCNNPAYGENRPACQFHLLADVHSFTRWTPENNSSNMSLVRATHCHHYRAIPINDGLHILFIEPRTGLLCIGSDAPIGGPTSLTRALVCVPPYEKDPLDSIKEERVPTVFAVGSDLGWGVRVVAAYQDRIVLYSVPLDVFKVLQKERERQGDGVMGDSDLARDFFLDAQRSRKRRESLVQNQNGDWEFMLKVSYRPTAMMWPFKIYGKEIGRMDKVVELGLQSSNGGVRVWAFGASGETNIIDVDTFTSTAQPMVDIPCKSLSIGPDGSLVSARLVDRAESGLLSPRSSRKRKQSEQRGDFAGQYATTHQLHNIMLDNPSQPIQPNVAQTASTTPKRRRPSFAACIVDFKVPELGAREGRWVESSIA